MAAVQFNLKEGDTLPLLRATLTDADSVAVDVTGSTVVFSMTNIETGVLKVTNGTVALITPASGIVEYTWLTADTDTPGTFSGEFEVTTGGGAIHTFPNARQNQLIITIESERV